MNIQMKSILCQKCGNSFNIISANNEHKAVKVYILAKTQYK